MGTQPGKCFCLPKISGLTSPGELTNDRQLANRNHIRQRQDYTTWRISSESISPSFLPLPLPLSPPPHPSLWCYTQALAQRSRQGVRDTLMPQVQKLRMSGLWVVTFKYLKVCKLLAISSQCVYQRPLQKLCLPGAHIFPDSQKTSETMSRRAFGSHPDRKKRGLDSQPSYNRTSCSDKVAVLSQELYLQRMAGLWGKCNIQRRDGFLGYGSVYISNPE